MGLLARRLQQAAAIAFELGDLLLSREIFQLAQRQEAPANPPPDPAYEHPDERHG